MCISPVSLFYVYMCHISLVFEILTLKNKTEIARGGRYDDLLRSLGSKKNISAVGAAINLKNLLRVVEWEIQLALAYQVKED